MPFWGGSLPIVDPVMTSTGSSMGGPAGEPGSDPQPHKETLEQWLDILVYAPLGFALDSNKPTADLAARGRKHMEAARLLGRMALEGFSTQPAPDAPADANQQPETKPG